MQEATVYSANPQPQFPEQEQLKCPRCDSTNTKFCYYNNYNLSQPRHFCKTCRRYWTKGGALRNIPVGGGSRKNNSKRTTTAKRHAAAAPPPKPRNSSSENHESQSLGNSFAGQFGDFLAAAAAGSGGLGALLGPGGGQFGNFHDGPALNDGLEDPDPGRNVDLNPDGFLNIGGGGDAEWSGGSNSWPDLAMYTPGSTFQ